MKMKNNNKNKNKKNKKSKKNKKNKKNKNKKDKKKKISRGPVYRTRWERRAFYNSINKLLPRE